MPRPAARGTHWVREASPLPAACAKAGVARSIAERDIKRYCSIFISFILRRLLHLPG